MVMESPRKIKILNIITRLDHGGAPMSMLNTLRYIDRERFEIHIVTGLIDESLKKYDDYFWPGLKIFTVHTLVRDINLWKDVAAFCKIFFMIKKEQYDIVHCHTSKAGFVGRLAAKCASVQAIIYAPHGNIFVGYFGKFKTIFFVLLEKFAATFTDKIITLTKRGIDPYLEHGIGVKSQYLYIYNGIDVDDFNFKGGVNINKKKHELGLDEDCPVATIIGRFVPVKGHVYLIDSIVKVVKLFPDSKFLFVGDGPLMEQLVNHVKALGLIDNIIFLGARYDVAEILACADLFLLSSINEGFGIVLLEAMSMKKPIVATGVDGVPEIVVNGENGLLVPPKEPSAMADAIIKLFSQKELAVNMGLNGYERAKNKFDILDSTKKTEKLYYALSGS